MKNYIKLSFYLDHFILDVGINDLGSDRSPELIAKFIINLPLTLKNELHDVSVLNIIVRNVNENFNKKWCKVNAALLELYKEKNRFLIYNPKKIKPRHLNGMKLHLNQKGSILLSDTLTKEISHWQFSSENLDSYSEEWNANLSFTKQNK